MAINLNTIRAFTSTGLIGGILASIIYIEGDYTNDPQDPGGETKYGITVNVAREYGYTGSMQELTLEKANEIYTNLYVISPGFHNLVDISPAVTHKLIDAGVNVGTARVSLWFQKALNRYSRDGQDYKKIKEDGSVGPNTIAAYKALSDKRGPVCACELVIKAIDGYQANYYLSLEKYARYIVGWVDKRVGNVPLNQCRGYDLTLPLKITE